MRQIQYRTPLMLLESRPQAETPQSTLRGMPEGIAGTRATLAAMRAAALAAHTTLEIRDLAENIIAGVPAKDFRGELEAIQQWVKDNIRYTRDPTYAETLKIPHALLEAPQGDCDDQATLVAALALSIGFKPRFVAIAVDNPGIFDHVYTEVKLGTRWLSVETTEPVPVGWQPEGVKTRLEWHI
ncbi:MAG: transglutaminase domain-containing protein [Patescibacteria group bacterium]|nr:transglutaminase domain-containing protein [Patescibacteria group bacterium]